MKTLRIVGLVSVLFVASTPMFAQFKEVAKQVKNMIRLEQSVQRAVWHRFNGKMIIRAWVPEYFVAGQEIGLTGAIYPFQITAANVSFAYKVDNTPKLTAFEVGTQFILGGEDTLPVGKAFYEDQNELAQDLNRFYEGQGVVRMEGKRTVKLYSLPVDGILYKPAGYKEPVVLQADDYFVVYDMDGNTGKLVENTPENLQFYSRSGDSHSFEEVVNYGKETYRIPIKTTESVAPKIEQEINRLSRENGMDLEPSDFFTVQPSVPVQRDMRTTHIRMATAGISEPKTQNAVHNLLEPGRAKVAAMREQNGYEEDWAAVHASKYYISQASLGRDLETFYRGKAPQLFNKDTRQVGYVYEIPVNGIGYMSPGTMPFTLDPVNQVFFYAKDGSGRLYDRSVLEDPERFEMVNQTRDAHSLYEENYLSSRYERQLNENDALWNKEQLPRVFSSQNDLGQILHAFHKQSSVRVTNNFTRQECYIYEIPVCGLRYAPAGATPRVLDPEAEVVLFNEKMGGQLVERSRLEDPLFFTFDK